MPMIAWAVTDLPEPDSPSTASVSPASRWYDTPLITRATPSLVRNSTCRSRTSSRWPPGGVAEAGVGPDRVRVGHDVSPQLRVEGVADRVAEHDEGQHGQREERRRARSAAWPTPACAPGRRRCRCPRRWSAPSGRCRGSDSVASAAMKEPSAMVSTTMAGASAFGRMCRHMIRPLPAPSIRAAAT